MKGEAIERDAQRATPAVQVASNTGRSTAQIAAVAIARRYALLTTDRDFDHAVNIVPLKLA